MHIAILCNKMLFDNKKITYHNMAGGFDRMEVGTASTRSEPHTAQASVMEVC